MSINLLSIITSIQSVQAKDLGIFKSYESSKAFNYGINIPQTNNSLANRVCVDNYEYEIGTNLSLIEPYKHENFSIIATRYNDVDFDYSNYRYQSTKASLYHLVSGLDEFLIDYQFTNSLKFKNCKVANIIDDIQDVGFEYKFTFLDYSYILINFQLPYRRLIISDAYTNLLTVEDFFPVYAFENNFYLKFDKNSTSIEYESIISFIAFDDYGNIIQENSVNINLNQYRDMDVIKFEYGIYSGSIGDTIGFIGFDSNFISDKSSNIQPAIMNLDFSFVDMRTFYLTNVPFYTTSFNNMSSGVTLGYMYARTTYKNRYLDYKTNTTLYNRPLYNRINSEYIGSLSDSFSIKLELSINDTVYPPILSYVFEKYNFYFFMDYASHWNFYINSSFVAFSKDIVSNVILLAEFKNKIFAFTIFENNIAHYYEYAINDKFVQLNTQWIQLTNVYISSLKLGNIKKYSGYISMSNDVFTFQNRVTNISQYCTYRSILPISIPDTPNVFDQNSVEYTIRDYYVYDMKFECFRSSANGIFTLTSDFSYIRDIFINDSLSDFFSYNFLEDKQSGNLYVDIIFPSSTEPEVRLHINYKYTYILIYTDHLPSNNLLIAKSLEIFIPLLIIGIIVIGFKSNSDSKYLPIIGMYIALFTLYLMLYMSLLFMLLCMIFLTLGLYIIIKNEKGNEI